MLVGRRATLVLVGEGRPVYGKAFQAPLQFVESVDRSLFGGGS